MNDELLGLPISTDVNATHWYQVHGMFISINVARFAELAKLEKLKKDICSSKSLS